MGVNKKDRIKLFIGFIIRIDVINSRLEERHTSRAELNLIREDVAQLKADVSAARDLSEGDYWKVLNAAFLVLPKLSSSTGSRWIHSLSGARFEFDHHLFDLKSQ